MSSLGHDDLSGFAFAKEMLNGDKTAAVNFDRFLKHPKYGFIIIEYLLCDEEQKKKHNTTPYTSHPKKYWNQDKRKFLSLWEAATKLDGVLYLVNYAAKGSPYEDEILLIKVLEMNDSGITKEEITKFNRLDFQKWFRELNKECLIEVA